MKHRLDQLELSLSRKMDICISRGEVCDFPRILYKPFCIFGVGMIVCDKGHFTFSVASEVYEVRAGETVFLSEDTIFFILSKSSDLLVHILFYRTEQIRELLGNLVQQVQLYVKMSPKECYVWKTNQEPDLIRYMELLGCTMRVDGNLFLLNERRLLLISLTYRLCSIFQQKFLSESPVTQKCTERFLRLIELIDHYYMSERGVKFYADKLCLSPKYLSELSKSVCGYTAQELVFKAIVRGSIAMLTGTTRTVQEIAAAFNFPNSSSFGTFFKKETGMSPKNFRVMNQGKYY